ncbi:hypothetical protein OC834_000400 [Tilletia horrida]|nr:hypothetical protein OC834_000400 [Tilletia horrida]
MSKRRAQTAQGARDGRWWLRGAPGLRMCVLAALSLFAAALVLAQLVSAFFPNPVDGAEDFELEVDLSIDGAMSRRSRPAHLAESFSRRDYSPLQASSPLLQRIPKLADPGPSIDHRIPTSFLSKILIPRVPGTENNTLVQRTIAEVFERELAPKPASPHGPARSGWTLHRQTFEDNTPEGKRKFTNLIATKEPDAPRKLMLAAHFDSKFFKRGSGNEGFIGATDSAAPCAMLVDTVRALDALLDRRAEKRKERHGSIAADTTLQIVFFDGEEAFHDWTHSDSIYGARALASNWSELVIPPAVKARRGRRDEEVDERGTQDEMADNGDHEETTVDSADALQGRRYTPSASTPVKPVDTIEHMVLLDLLGAPNPSVPDYFAHTSWLYDHLVDAEKKLREAGLLMWTDPKKTFFGQRHAWGGIEDDHLPFAARGVPIFHLIPSPFPPVWHRISDDASALDYPTMYAWAMMMRLFVIEYLGLAPYLESAPASSS